MRRWSRASGRRWPRAVSALEALAEHIADLCLRAPRIAAVDVTVAKPGALPGIGVAVTMRRSR